MKAEELVETVKKTIAAPSCCKELKAAGEAWLKATGAAKAEAGKALLKELKEDVSTIDGFVAFTASETGAKVFGKEQAMKMHAAAIDAKGKGVRYCLCDACTNGGKIIDDPAGL